jgi:hypothetical protein
VARARRGVAFPPLISNHGLKEAISVGFLSENGQNYDLKYIKKD